VVGGRQPRQAAGVPSNKVQVAIVVGVVVLLALLDWVINDSPRTAIVVTVGAAVGLVVRFVRKARRGSDRA
jgi:Flp pilus assembly protein TadB